MLEYREKIGQINDRLNAIIAREMEIAKRAKAIADEIKDCNDDKVIAERKSETEKMTAERASLEEEKGSLEAQKDELIKKNDEELAKNVRAGKPFMEGEKNMTIAERREKFFKALNEKTLSYNVRSLLSTDTPFAVGADGVTGIKTVAPSLVDFVEIQELPGKNNEKVMYDKDTDLAFNEHTPGTDITASDASTGIVELPGVEMAVLTEVDNGAIDNPNVDVDDFIQKKLAKAWRAKASAMIANGIASKFYGIGNAVDSESNSMVEAVTLTAIDENALTSLFLGANGTADEVPGNAILVLTKAQLAEFGKVRGSDKKKVYTITPDRANQNIGTIVEGGVFCTYILCSSLPANTMLYGKGLAYRLNIYSDLKIESSRDVDFKKNMTVFRGLCTIGGNVTELKAWAKVAVTPGK